MPKKTPGDPRTRPFYGRRIVESALEIQRVCEAVGVHPSAQQVATAVGAKFGISISKGTVYLWLKYGIKNVRTRGLEWDREGVQIE